MLLTDTPSLFRTVRSYFRDFMFVLNVNNFNPWKFQTKTTHFGQSECDIMGFCFV